MSGFFAGVAQEDVAIRQYRGKSPMFFRDLHMMGAVFTADLARLREALPDRLYRPLRLWPGVGLAAIHCLEYKDTDVGPYCEVSLSIAIHRPGRSLLPGPLEALRAAAFGRYHAYVAELPVTTEVALYGGLDFFNFPKYRADISFRETASHRVCTLREAGSLDLILEFEGRRLAAKPSRRARLMTLNSYPRMDGRAWRARMVVNRRESAAALGPGRCAVRLGSSPRAAPFRTLGLGWPVQYLFAPKAEAILFRPEIL